MWTQHLFSKRVRSLRADYAGTIVDEYRVLTVGGPDHAFADVEQVSRRSNRRRAREAVFIQDCGAYVQIGADGFVRTALEKDSPFGYERTLDEGDEQVGRPITYIHSYFALKGAQMPSFSTLVACQSEDLGVLLEAVNQQPDAVRVEPRIFPPSGPETGEWDRIAAEFSSGRHLGELAIFTRDGDFVELVQRTDLKPTVPSATTLSTGAPSAADRGTVPAVPQARRPSPKPPKVRQSPIGAIRELLGGEPDPLDDRLLIRFVNYLAECPQEDSWNFLLARHVPPRDARRIQIADYVRRKRAEGRNPREIEGGLKKVEPHEIADAYLILRMIEDER